MHVGGGCLEVLRMLVHHGLFWPGLQTVTGTFHRQLTLALENGIAVYSAHLPLDVHPIIGNNAQLAAALGLRSTTRFFEEKGQLIGLKARASISRDELVRKLEKSLGGKVKTFAFGPKKTKTIGIITGGAGSEIYRVAREKIDTFITGEAPHWAAVAAGVKALATRLSKKFSLPWRFIDCPTGL